MTSPLDIIIDIGLAFVPGGHAARGAIRALRRLGRTARKGRRNRYDGDYQDWLDQRARYSAEATAFRAKLARRDGTRSPAERASLLRLVRKRRRRGRLQPHTRAALSEAKRRYQRALRAEVPVRPGRRSGDLKKSIRVEGHIAFGDIVLAESMKWYGRRMTEFDDAYGPVTGKRRGYERRRPKWAGWIARAQQQAGNSVSVPGRDGHTVTYHVSYIS